MKELKFPNRKAFAEALKKDPNNPKLLELQSLIKQREKLRFTPAEKIDLATRNVPGRFVADNLVDNARNMYEGYKAPVTGDTLAYAAGKNVRRGGEWVKDASGRVVSKAAERTGEYLSGTARKELSKQLARDVRGKMKELGFANRKAFAEALKADPKNPGLLELKTLIAQREKVRFSTTQKARIATGNTVSGWRKFMNRFRRKKLDASISPKQVDVPVYASNPRVRAMQKRVEADLNNLGMTIDDVMNTTKPTKAIERLQGRIKLMQRKLLPKQQQIIAIEKQIAEELALNSLKSLDDLGYKMSRLKPSSSIYRSFSALQQKLVMLTEEAKMLKPATQFDEAASNSARAKTTKPNGSYSYKYQRKPQPNRSSQRHA